MSTISLDGETVASHDVLDASFNFSLTSRVCYSSTIMAISA